MPLSLDAFVCIPLPSNLYGELARRYENGVSSVVANVVEDFLQRTALDFEIDFGGKSSFQWDALSLPDGTEIRTLYYGEYQTARIEDGRLIWEGEKYPSMSRLASAMRGGTSNNAWRVLEIKRPSDAMWQLADRFRK